LTLSFFTESTIPSNDATARGQDVSDERNII
jgi:hypothetical protein